MTEKSADQLAAEALSTENIEKALEHTQRPEAEQALREELEKRSK